METHNNIYMENKNLHIAIFLPSLAGGGAEKVFVNLANSFFEKGFEVDFVLGKSEGPFLSHLNKGIKLVNLNVKRMSFSLYGLSKYLRANHPDVLISGLAIANLIAILAKKITRVKTKVIVSLHSVESLSLRISSYGKRQLMRFLYPRVINFADDIVAVSEGVVLDFSKNLGVPSKKIKIINNPIVDSKLFQMAEEEITEPWFSNNGLPKILAVGRLTASKDFHTLISAFAMVRKNIPSQLIILGEGEDRPNLVKLITNLGLQDEVCLPGFVKNPYKFMKKSNVFVVSSKHESFGNVLVEAMACGCQVISTDCPFGPREILEKGKWGRLFPVGDFNALVSVLIDTLSSNVVLDVTARANDFSFDRIMKQYFNLLDLN